jgi:O-antigen ligase
MSQTTYSDSQDYRKQLGLLLVNGQVRASRVTPSTPSKLSFASIITAVLLYTGALADPGGYSPYLGLRWLTMSVAVAIGVVWAAVTGNAVRRRILFASIAFAVVEIASAAASASPKVAAFGLPGRRTGLMALALMFGAAYTGCRVGRNVKSLISLIRAIAVLGLAVSLPALLQRLGVALPGISTLGTNSRVTGAFGSAAQLGAVCALLLPATLWSAIDQAAPSAWRSVASVSAVFVALTLGLSGARAAWIGSAGSLVLLTILVLRRQPRSVVSHLAPGFVVLAGSIAVVPSLRARFTGLGRLSGGTVGGRRDIWSAAIPAIRDRPILGWGPDQSRTGLLRHLPSWFEERYGDSELVDRAHSALLDQLLWTGSVGLLALLVLASLCVGEIRRQAAETERLVLSISVIAFGGHLLFNFPIPEIDVLAWFLVGAAVGSAKPATAALASWSFSRLALPVLLAIAGLATTVLSTRWLVADHQLRDGSAAETNRDIPAALHHYEAAAAVAPELFEAREALTRAYVRFGATGKAPESAAGLARYAPGDPYVAELQLRSNVQAALASGDQARGQQLVTDYEELTKMYPSRIPFRVGLALAELSAGSIDRAREIATAASAVEPLSANAELALSVIETKAGNQAAAAAHRERAAERAASR